MSKRVKNLMKNCRKKRKKNLRNLNEFVMKLGLNNLTKSKETIKSFQKVFRSKKT